jgi:undecaprenyl phosphate-alpha-L-ara4N flippase subunit ArnE
VTLTVVLLFAASICADVAGQVFFKIGAERLPEFTAVNRAAFFKGLLADWWLLAGIVTYALELIIWLRILAEVPISVAFPIASANFLGVTLAGHFFLKEKIGRAQWSGALLITMGVALVAGST